MSNDADRVSIIAIDTGGTFTDVVMLHDGRITVVKVPSTPQDPAIAVLEGIRKVRERSAELTEFVLVHGSTVATNALLERRGAHVALVTNRGFEDIIEIGRQNRPQLYALVGTRPPPLVARDARIGIAGRLGPEGEELEPLDDAELRALADQATSADAIAICLLHSYASDAHERRVALALESTGKPISVSCELLPEFREFERTATTVVNAYVSPIMDRYLGRLEADAGARRVRIMGSGGGAIPVRRARKEAVHTILSGPAGGVMGALATATLAGFDQVLTFDMGGTSTDVSLCPGRPLHTREFSIAGVPVAVPVLDIHTVGAGGGSIARVDAGGALRVGPESAGAVPGPICYGRGGREVTVTDAHVFLGRLPAAAWRHALSDAVGGERPRLDRAAIEAPMRALADGLGCALADAAEGVVAVADAAMEGALRVISVERGYDPAEFTLVPFGGAAGLHAAELATRLGVPRVLVPPAPGALSAYGMLVAPVRKDASRTVLLSASRSDELDLEDAFRELEQRAQAAMAEEEISEESLQLVRRIDARYKGQSYELTVPASDWVEALHAGHEARYGYARRGAIVQAVTLRVEALALSSDARFPGLAEAEGDPVPVDTGMVLFGGTTVETPRYERSALRAGHAIAGPAVISEYTATCWVPPGWIVRTGGDASLLLEPLGVGGSKGAG
jgi:N-methylhydantoinase A